MLQRLFDWLKSLFQPKKKLPALPYDLRSATEALHELLGRPTLLVYKSEDDFISEMSFRLGMHVRNTWGLWDENSKITKWFEVRGILHADDKSDIIFKCYWRQVAGVPWRLDSLIEGYRAYWGRLGIDPDTMKWVEKSS